MFSVIHQCFFSWLLYSGVYGKLHIFAVLDHWHIYEVESLEYVPASNVLFHQFKTKYKFCNTNDLFSISASIVCVHVPFLPFKPTQITLKVHWQANFSIIYLNGHKYLYIFMTEVLWHCIVSLVLWFLNLYWPFFFLCMLPQTKAFAVERKGQCVSWWQVYLFSFHM